MENSINNLIMFIKENVEKMDRTNCLIILNDGSISVRIDGFRYNEKKFEFDEKVDVSMFGFIYGICNKILEEFSITDLFSDIEVQSFSGYRDAVDSGPIHVYIEIDDNRHLNISFTSTVKKNIDWLIGFMRYIEFKKESDNSEEYKELKNYIDTLDIEALSVQGETEVRSKK